MGQRGEGGTVLRQRLAKRGLLLGWVPCVSPLALQRYACKQRSEFHLSFGVCCLDESRPLLARKCLTCSLDSTSLHRGYACDAYKQRSEFDLDFGVCCLDERGHFLPAKCLTGSLDSTSLHRGYVCWRSGSIAAERGGRAPSWGAASAVFREDWYKKMRWILVRIEAQSAAIASYGEHWQRRVEPKDAHFCTKKSETLH